MLFADAKENLEATKFILGEGSGSNEPEGLISKLAEASLVETRTEEKVEAGDVYTLQEKVGPRFQPNASWLSTLTVANQIYRFYSPAGEEPPLFNQDRTALLGKPWTECSHDVLRNDHLAKKWCCSTATSAPRTRSPTALG